MLAEAWHEVRDQTVRLDDRLRAEVAQVLPAPLDLPSGEPVGP